MTKYLSQILPSVSYKLIAADGTQIDDNPEINSIPISELVFDSRLVKKDSLFFAWQGTHKDGNDYIAQAVLNGANAVVFQGELSAVQKEEIAKAIIKRTIENAVSDENRKFAPVLVCVENSRTAMAPLAAAFYDNPSERLIVIGVTGTEGKSSTVSFIWQLLRECGQKAGFISTVEYSFGGEAQPNPEHQTTPESPVIQHHLNEMLENGCKFAVVEASSHGLSKQLNRLGNVLFDCAVFMNVTLEHLEFHKNFETYRNDKANLFRALDKHSHSKIIAGERQKINSLGIVNLEDPSAEFFMQCTKSNVYGFTTNGLAGKAAAETGDRAVELPAIPKKICYMTASNIASATYGIGFSVDADKKDAVFPQDFDPSLPREHSHFEVKAPVSGAFNAYNLMAAIIAVSSVTGFSFEEVAKKAVNLKPVKGRMTVIDQGQPFELIVDYAHTPSSFETIFPPLRKRCRGKMIALFGSGGERDLTKRPLQGEIAARFCDTLILTDEDPRGEDSMSILKMIAKGAEKEGKVENEDLFLIPDRKTAIRKAFSLAQNGDIVLLLGKSHENSIIYKNFVMPYDEISEAKTALSEMGY